MKKEDAVAILLKNGAVAVENINVNGVSVNTDGGSLEKSFVTLQLDKPIKRLADDGKEEEITKVTLSVISVIGGISDTIGSSVRHHVQGNPVSLELILDGAKITILQEKCGKGPHKNLFSSDDKESTLDKPMYVNYLTDAKLSTEGNKVVKQIQMFRTFGAAMFGTL